MTRREGGSKLAWVGLLFSLGAVAFLFWRVDFGDLKGALTSAEVVWLVPAVVLFFVLFALRCWRWAMLLGHTRFWPTWHANAIGYMFNATLPLRLGEIARVFVIARTGETTATRALSAALVERLIDLAAVVLLFAGFALRIPMRPAFTRAATLGSVAVVLCVIVGALVVWKGETVERLLRPRLLRFGEERADSILAKFREVRDGFRAVGSVKGLLQCLAFTIAIWIVTILLAACCMKAFLPTETDLTRAGFVVVIANLGGALPSAPGGLGIVQGFATSALVVPFGLPEGGALAFVLVWSLFPQLTLVVLGLISIGRVGMTFSQIRAGAGSGTLPER